MKFVLMEDGFDEAVNDIRGYLKKALETKNTKEKNLMIAHASGIANAIYKLVTTREEEKAGKYEDSSE